jgi:DNA-binding MarR family transcriptional regulator
MAKDRKPLTDGDYYSLAEFRFLLRRLLSFSEEAARAAGLAPQQHQALLAIKGYGGKLTIGELADKLFVKPHSAAELAERLTEAKLVQRRADEVDKRRVLLVLTKIAENKLEQLSSSHREELQKLAPLLRPLLDQLNADGRVRRERPEWR